MLFCNLLYYIAKIVFHSITLMEPHLLIPTWVHAVIWVSSEIITITNIKNPKLVPSILRKVTSRERFIFEFSRKCAHLQGMIAILLSRTLPQTVLYFAACVALTVAYIIYRIEKKRLQDK